MHFTSTDLAFRDYYDTNNYNGQDPRTSGIPDTTSFDRTQQQEVLYLINFCYQAWDWPVYTKGPGRKIERLIRIYLPGNGWTQLQVFDWIRDNWKHYWHLLPG